MKPSYYELIPGIFVGNGYCLNDIPTNIKRIVNCTIEYDPLTEEELNKSNITDYIRIKLEDKSDIIKFENAIKLTNQFIEKISPIDSPILIHCHMGMSRSSCVAMAYVCHSTKISARQALELVYKKRPKEQQGFINPHYFYRILNKIYLE